MSQVAQTWQATGVERGAGERNSVRTLVEKQIPETRIFVDEFYQGFSASGGRSKIDRLIQGRNRSPWPLTDRPVPHQQPPP